MNERTNYLNKPFLVLGLWALYHLVVWTLVPLLNHVCLPLDSVEAVMWGSQWQWGYDKHPPLSAWAAELFADLFNDGGIYFLSQLCVVTAGLGIYKLGRLFKLSVPQAVLSVLLLDTVFFYSYGSVEFNVNVIQMPFWAWGWFFGIDAVQNKRFASWIGLGTCVALGALSKYIAVFMLVPLFAAWWRRGELISAFKSAGLYVAGATAVVLFLPHLIWMYQHEWITITYGLRRGASGESFWWHHLWNPVKFMLSQGALLLPALIPAWLCGRGTFQPLEKTPGAFAIATGAYLFLAFFALATGMEPVTMWAAPIPLAIGIWLVPRFGMDRKPAIPLSFIAACTLLYIIGYTAVYGFGPRYRELPHRVNFPGPEIARQLDARWHENQDGPLQYIIADEWLGGIVNHYGESEAAVMIRGNLERSTYLTEEQVREAGAMVLWLKIEDHQSDLFWPIFARFPDLQERYPRMQMQPDLLIPWPKRTDGKIGRYGVAYIPPQPRSNP